MPEPDGTAPPTDTTPPPSAAGKTSKRAAAPDVTAVPAADPAAEAVDTAATEPAIPEAATPTPGWFRNTAATTLIVVFPTRELEPGEVTWLPDDPRHPNLERCDPPAPAPAADTTGSEL